MNRLHGANRKERTEGLMFKNIKMREILQYVCFLLILLFWLLYQNYRSYQIREDYRFEHIDNKLRNERIGKLLGRKGGLRISIDGSEVDLYGMDVVGGTEGIKHVTKDNAEGEEDGGSAADGSYEDEFLRNHTDEESVNGDSSDDSNRKSSGEYLAKGGKTEAKLQEDKANASTVISEKWGDESEKDTVISRKKGDGSKKGGRRNGSEAVSVVSFGAVILKSNDDNWKVFRFNDENGVPKHESGPSRRTDIEVVSLLEQQNISRPENDSKEMDECQKLCLQNFLDKERLSKAEQEAVHEEIKELTAVDSGKETMRELLQKVS